MGYWSALLTLQGALNLCHVGQQRPYDKTTRTWREIYCGLSNMLKVASWAHIESGTGSESHMSLPTFRCKCRWCPSWRGRANNTPRCPRRYSLGYTERVVQTSSPMPMMPKTICNECLSFLKRSYGPTGLRWASTELLGLLFS